MKEGHHKTHCSLGGLSTVCMGLEEIMVGTCETSGDLMRTVTISICFAIEDCIQCYNALVSGVQHIGWTIMYFTEWSSLGPLLNIACQPSLKAGHGTRARVSILSTHLALYTVIFILLTVFPTM